MKSLPKNPSLEFLKKEAKSLRALHKQGNIFCCERIRQCDVSFKTQSDTEVLAAKFSINAAQKVIAREYGYSSWATLKHFIESLHAPLYQGVSNLQAYHKTITDSYDKRSSVYDDYIWAREKSIQLVEYSPPKSGDSVLDIGTGTGTIPFYIAGMVGETGMITGVDISKGMVERCNKKLSQSNLSHLKFIYGDGVHLDFPDNSFDRIYACASLYWMSHPLAALRRWFELLKPGGTLAFNAWPNKSFIWGGGVREALRPFGVEFTIHEFSGNKDKTRAITELAGFSDIHIRLHEDGRYLSLEDATETIADAMFYTPGQHPHPLKNISDEIIQKAQKSFEAEVEKRVTDKGVWHDMSMYDIECIKR